MRSSPRPLRFAVALTTILVSGCAVVPTPLTGDEVTVRASDSLARMVASDQEPVTRPIDLYEAMARALKYNLDHRVEQMEAALRIKELDLAHFKLLPDVVASSGYYERNNFDASSSVNVLTGQQSLATSTSREKRIGTADVEFSWNILDFGLSYVRARQAADQHLIAEEMRRKVAHRVIEDVRTAYWRAISADRLLGRLRSLEGRVRGVQANSRAIADDLRTSPITAVTYERELVEIKRTIQELERDLLVARTQLASLMNIAPGTSFQLVQPGRALGDLVLAMPARDMVWTAVQNRAELREVWYRQRINQHDLDAALIELLPGIQVFAGTDYDSNDFLYNSNWLSWGAKASWNVIRLLQYPAKREVIEAQDQLLDERSLAVTMAVVTQVHVSRVRFHQSRKELETADEYLDVQRRLLKLIRAEASAERVSEQTLIREEMNTLVAEVRFDIAYANLQNAFSNVHASMGLDLYAEALDMELGTSDLAAALRRAWADRGDRGAGKVHRVSAAR